MRRGVVEMKRVSRKGWQGGVRTRMRREKLQTPNSKLQSRLAGSKPQIPKFSLSATSVFLVVAVIFGALRQVCPAVATNNAEEDFKLRPPRAEMAPSFWEQNANWIIPLAIAAVLAVALLAWFFLRPRPGVEEAPEIRARRELEKLASAPADREVLSRASQILKYYLAQVFGLPKEEMTTAEFCSALAANGEAGEELVKNVIQFLRRNDDLKFAPGPIPASTVPEALKVLQQAEARRAELRTTERTGSQTAHIPAVAKS